MPEVCQTTRRPELKITFFFLIYKARDKKGKRERRLEGPQACLGAPVRWRGRANRQAPAARFWALVQRVQPGRLHPRPYRLPLGLPLQSCCASEAIVGTAAFGGGENCHQELRPTSKQMTTLPGHSVFVNWNSKT